MGNTTKQLLSGLLLLFFTVTTYAQEVPEKDWGLAVIYRWADIPFNTGEDQLSDFIPLMFYDGDRFFLNGLTAGIKLYDTDDWKFSLISRYRFFDIPTDLQDLTRINALDLGGQAKYRFSPALTANIELLSDTDGRFHGVLDGRYHWDHGPWDLTPYATLRYKSASFNDRYYGLDGISGIDNKIGSGTDLTLGSEIRYHVTSNFYLLGRAQLTVLDKNASDSRYIDDTTYGEVYLGVGIYNNKKRDKTSSLEAKPYIRVAYGWGTPSDFGEILVFDWEPDEQNNTITSIFYGHPLADSLFGAEMIDIYLTTGYVYHHSSDTVKQTLAPGEGINDPEFSGIGDTPCNGSTDCEITYLGKPSNEYVLGIKAYFNFNWPMHWRLGLAEGLSYIDDIDDLEQREMDAKGYRSSKLMNYVGASADFSIGSLFGARSLKELYLGVGIHHRSSVFGISSAFGRIKGGSNFNSVYLQYHF